MASLCGDQTFGREQAMNRNTDSRTHGQAHTQTHCRHSHDGTREIRFAGNGIRTFRTLSHNLEILPSKHKKTKTRKPLVLSTLRPAPPRPAHPRPTPTTTTTTRSSSWRSRTANQSWKNVFDDNNINDNFKDNIQDNSINDDGNSPISKR